MAMSTPTSISRRFSPTMDRLCATHPPPPSLPGALHQHVQGKLGRGVGVLPPPSFPWYVCRGGTQGSVGVLVSPIHPTRFDEEGACHHMCPTRVARASKPSSAVKCFYFPLSMSIDVLITCQTSLFSRGDDAAGVRCQLPVPSRSSFVNRASTLKRAGLGSRRQRILGKRNPCPA